MFCLPNFALLTTLLRCSRPLHLTFSYLLQLVLLLSALELLGVVALR